VRRVDLLREIDTLEEMSSTRLSAAMIGLLRSFTVNVFDAGSAEGHALCRMVNQDRLPERKVVEILRQALRDVHARLREVGIGSGADQAAELDNPNRLFECGWSWGIAQDAPTVETSENVGIQRPGLAIGAPYLYFTVAALGGIESLFSERTRILGLLNEEQQRLARALQLRWDATQSYWSVVARFGRDRWPLEDLPWHTTDDAESDYFSILVTSMVIRDLAAGRSDDVDLGRIGQVLEELANRGRINRRPLLSDPAIDLHAPGVPFSLHGSELLGDGRMVWSADDFSALVLQATLRITGMVRDIELRQRLITLADSVWDHVAQRRLHDGPGRDLWDQPSGAFPQVEGRYELPSWSYTERLVDCLTIAANVASHAPLRSERLVGVATDLLNEANHLFDQELLNGSLEVGPSMRHTLRSAQFKLRRAREILLDKPGTAAALASEVLRELDQLAAARRGAVEAS
jgi:hypothetical protein